MYDEPDLSGTAGQDTKPLPSSGKFEARRMELAGVALSTLGQMGYGGASLREIAQKSDYSHGVFHYYFKDRDDLISCAVRLFKRRCATRYDDAIDQARDQTSLIKEFAAQLLRTMREDSDMHRLWYDLRSQALFNEHLREDVRDIDTMLEQMVWRIVKRYFAFSDHASSASPAVAYALFDGFFQRMLFNWLSNQSQLTQDQLVHAFEDAMLRLK